MAARKPSATQRKRKSAQERRARSAVGPSADGGSATAPAEGGSPLTAPTAPAGAGLEKSETLDDANRRKAAALADRHELIVRERRGELLTRESVRSVVGEAFVVVRRRILALPDRLSSELSGRPREEIRQALQRELTAALTTLAADPFAREDAA